MSSFCVNLKNKLNNLICDMEKYSYLFTKNPKSDFTRKRNLSFSTTMNLLISMGGNTLNKELLEYFNYNTETVTSSAFVQRREKILPLAFKFLFNEFNAVIPNNKLYKGYRLLAIDGSDLAYPANKEDTENYFQTQKNTKAYNLIHLNAVYDLLNRTYVDAEIQSRRKFNEHAALISMVDRFKWDNKAIFIADRGYESYNNFAHINNAGYNFLIRVKDIDSGGILSSFSFDDCEFDITIKRLLTRVQTNDIKNAPDIYKFLPNNSKFDYLPPKSKDFYEINFRVVRFKISDDKYECLITNLKENEFNIADLKELYHKRWGIETSFRELKYSIGLINFHSKKAEFIMQEIYARLIMYNFCETITTHTIITTKSTVHSYQANFTMAIQICKKFYCPVSNINPLNVEALIQNYILPVKKGRQKVRKPKNKSAVCFNYRIA